MNTDHDDAARYRKLRAIAVDDHTLESVVAMGQLDFLPSEKEFDAAVDAFVAPSVLRFEHVVVSGKPSGRGDALTPDETREVKRLRRAIHAALRLLRRPVGQHHPHAGEAVRVLGRAIETKARTK